jgi:DnaK suppressor protein
MTMTTTTTVSTTTTRIVDPRSQRGTKGVPPPLPLTNAQLHELEGELRRELAALERRLTSERADRSADEAQLAITAAAVSHRASDIVARRDVVAGALARLGAGTYGTCGRCEAPIPFGRLLAMPEVAHCLSCTGRP